MNYVTIHETYIHFKIYTKIVIEVQREFEWGVLLYIFECNNITTSKNNNFPKIFCKIGLSPLLFRASTFKRIIMCH